MTNEELMEIRERADKAVHGHRYHDSDAIFANYCRTNLPKLLAEIERLREEVVRLRGMAHLSCPNCIEDCAAWVGHGVPCGKDW